MIASISFYNLTGVLERHGALMHIQHLALLNALHEALQFLFQRYLYVLQYPVQAVPKLVQFLYTFFK